MIATFLASVLVTGSPPALPQSPRLADPRSFVVHLVDDRGQPLADARVQLGASIRYPGGSSWHGLRGAPDRTDDAGRLAIPEDPEWATSARLRIGLRDVAITGERAPNFEVSWDGKSGSRTLTVPRPGWIAGRVTRRTPGDRVLVDFERHNRATPQVLEVDAQGRFRLGPLAAGQHTFDFLLGLARETVEFDVPPGGTTDEILIDLNRGGWIVGQALGFDGRPLPSAEISLSFPGPFELFEPSIHPESTDARFVIGPLPPGLHSLQLWEDRGRIALAQRWVEVPESGDVVLELRAAGPPVSVTGSVRVGDDPVPHAFISLEIPGTQQSVRGPCDESGRFRLQVPRGGIYDLRVGGFLVEGLQLDEETEHVDIQVPANALEIVRPAFGDASKTWWFDIHPIDPWRLDPCPSLNTEETDRPRMEGLAPGTYRVSARQGPQAIAWSRVHVPEAGTARLVFDDVPTAGVELVGRTARGEPVPVTSFVAQDDDGLWLGSLDRVPPGTLRVLATNQLEVGLAEVELRPGERRAVEVILAPAASLELSGARGGAPVVPQAFLLHESGYRVGSPLFPLVTGPGTRAFRALPEGRYTIVARVPGGPWRRESIALRAGEAATRSLRFD